MLYLHSEWDCSCQTFTNLQTTAFEYRFLPGQGLLSKPKMSSNSDSSRNVAKIPNDTTASELVILIAIH